MPEPTPLDAATLAELRRDMLGFAQLQLRDAGLAEDAVQEALLGALDGQTTFAGRSALRTWVFSILRHKIIDLLRARQRQTPLSAFAEEGASLDETCDRMFRENAHWAPDYRPSAWISPDDSLQNRQFWMVFEVCLSRLPENTGRVFMMREVLGLDTGEICESLGLSTSNCHVILHRARFALRRCLEASWFTAGDAPC